MSVARIAAFRGKKLFKCQEGIGTLGISRLFSKGQAMVE
jgi:hypothetical protein